MANPEHLARLTAGIDSWHHWRATSGVVSPDLSGADLSPNGLWQTALMTASAATPTRVVMSSQPGGGADLAGVDLSNTDLRNVNLGMANLTGANLCAARLGFALLARTRLDGANLTHAKLHMTQLTKASAVAADFRYADLNYTILAGVDLRNARFADAMMAGCVLTDLDLRTADGLKFVIHTGPSSVGLDTVYRSGGQIPIEFLRGVGLRDELIRQTTGFSAAMVHFESCFISHSTSDLAFARRLHDDLQVHGVQCWFAPHDVLPGKKLYDQIDEAIRDYDRLLLILSEHSMASEWVKTEIANARRKELKQKRQVLFPISLVPYSEIRAWESFDADTGKDTAREVREYFIPDFTDWAKDPVAYATSFDKLLKGLKADSKPQR